MRPELLSPAGDWDCLRAAAACGADAVYFGMPRFNARMRAENFREEELPEVVAFLHSKGVKACVTLNVLVFSGELESAVEELRLLNSAGVDAVIIQDVGIAEIARRMFPALRVHASTQMTVTSPEGVRFAKELGVSQVVLARELSLRELAKFDSGLPLEMFVHGALCVAYSGQCLTSESLGQRSANRGECAQACRMPYELIVDGALRDLGDRRYLLSPQDLAAVNEIPELIRLGVASFKIEGRLKSPEYVAAVTSVYRRAIDAVIGEQKFTPSDSDWYRLEMAFSRGLFSGWMHGVNHQQLVPARFGKKRGAFLGRVGRTGRDFFELADNRRAAAPLALKAGDGVVFDTGGDTNREQGGRIFRVEGGAKFFLERGHVDFSRIQPGSNVWKTDDPALNREIRKEFSGRAAGHPEAKQPVFFRVSGRAGETLRLEARTGDVSAETASAVPLEQARTRPLTNDGLLNQFGRLEETPFRLTGLENGIEGEVSMPISELNRLRREAVSALVEKQAAARAPAGVQLGDILGEIPSAADLRPTTPALTVLCRSIEQIEAALECGVETIYADFEDIRRYKDAVAAVRQAPAARIFPATPRIQKAGESGFFKLIEATEPDGVLIRNIGAIEYFRNSPLIKIGDFSLNVANPVSAMVFRNHGLERLTISYDLNIGQVLDLLGAAPPEWFEISIHQHMPMFHMEHCVFAAFMSKGTTFLDCGRPCEKHRVHLRDRVGIEHPLRADVGCRNTLFNATPQSGAKHFRDLEAAGLRHFRVELLEEDGVESETVIRAYQSLLRSDTDGIRLLRELKALPQLGVTSSAP